VILQIWAHFTSMYYVNKKLNGSKGIAPLKDQCGTLTSDEYDKAEILNNYFSSVFMHDNGTVARCPTYCLRRIASRRRDASYADVSLHHPSKYKQRRDQGGSIGWSRHRPARCAADVKPLTELWAELAPKTISADALNLVNYGMTHYI